MTPVRIDSAHEIGHAAGSIWQYLNANGPSSLTKLAQELAHPKDVILQGIGWLAREGKIEYTSGKGRTRLLQLTES